MKNRFVVSIMALCCVIILASVFVGGSEAAVKEAEPKAETADVADVLTDMLNHNFVYGEDFDDTERLVDSSMGALLRFKDESDYIPQQYLTDFVKDMYGVNIVDLSSYNCDMPAKEGFVFVTPRGYSTYTHKNMKTENNEDGTISAKTVVTVMDHDGNMATFNAVSLFVPNSNSTFGYNIVYSEILNGNSL